HGAQTFQLVFPYHTIPSHPIPSRPVPSRPVPSRPVPSRPVPSRPVPSRPVPSRPVPSRPVPSRPVPSHPIPSHPTPSHSTPPHPILSLVTPAGGEEEADETQATNVATQGSALSVVPSQALMCQRYSFATVAKATDNWAEAHALSVVPSQALMCQRYSFATVAKATDNWAEANHQQQQCYATPLPAGGQEEADETQATNMATQDSTLSVVPSQALMCQRYSFATVATATDNWAEANHIGSGGYGEVYRGVCPADPSVVWAVKRAKILTNDFRREVRECGVVWVGYKAADCGAVQWDGQVEEMASKSHPHLVRLLGYCVDMDMTTEHHEQIVIYEFCSNGDLEKYLHGGPKKGTLSLQQRMDVLVGVARGLEYLHQFDIVHRDIKPANVLLDARMQPKVSDFGLVRMTEGTTVNPTRVVGTPGYVDPAYSRTNKATPMADVHSFGVLMLEVILTRPAVVEEKGVNTSIKDWAARRMEDRDAQGLKDPHLDSIPSELLLQVVELALRCTGMPASSRPRMREVASRLDALSKEFLQKTTSKADSRLESIDQEVAMRQPEQSLDDEFLRIDVISGACPGPSSLGSGTTLVARRPALVAFWLRPVRRTQAPCGPPLAPAACEQPLQACEPPLVAPLAAPAALLATPCGPLAAPAAPSAGPCDPPATPWPSNRLSCSLLVAPSLSVERGASGGRGSCPYVIHTGDRAGQTCGKTYTQHRSFSRLDDAWRPDFGDKAERPRWAELLRSKVAIFDLDYDAIVAAMYTLFVSADGDCYLCVSHDPGIEAAPLGASVSALPGTALAEALHTFTLYAGVSRCFFRNSTTLTPLFAHVPVRLADPSGGPILARSSTILPCRAVSASGQVAPPCSCRLLSHKTLLRHYRLGHPSLPRLHGMHSRLLVSGLPRSPPPLPPSPAPPYLPCIKGWQRAAPHSSSFPPTTAPLQTLHIDYTTVFPLRSKGEVLHVLIPWIHAVRLQLREWFRQDLPVLCLHSDRGGEFSFDLLWVFCRGEGILQSFTLLDSPHENGISERCIGLVMEVALTSMIHAAAPHFLWPFAVPYAMHQLNLWPRVPLPGTCGGRGRLAMGQCSGFGDLVPLFAIRLRTSSLPAPFPASSLAFPLTSLAGSFTTPPRAVSSPLRTSRVSQVDPLPGTVPVKVDVDSSAAQGAASRGAASGGAEPEGAEPGGAEPEGAEPGGAESGGAGSGGAEPGDAETAGVESGGAEHEGVEPGDAESRGAEPLGTASSGGPVGASPRLSPWPEPLSPQHLREWFTQHSRLRSGAAGAGESAARDTGARGAGVTVGAGDTGGAAAAGPGGACTKDTGAARTGGVGGAGAGDPTEPGAAEAGGAGAVGARAGGSGAGGAGARAAGVGGAGGTKQPRLYFVPLIHQLQPLLKQASQLPAPSSYTEQTSGLTKRRGPASRPASPVCTGRRLPRPRPPPIPSTQAMALRPSSIPQRVPLLPSPESSLPTISDPESVRARAASPTVSHLLATVFESTAASTLVAELVDYATALVAVSKSASPPSVGGECALGTDIECLAAAIPHFASMLLAPEGDPDAPDIPTPLSYTEAITGPYSSQWQAAMDAKMASRKSTATYIDAIPPSRANIVDRMWISRTFSSTPKMTTLWVLLHVVAQRDYKLHSLDFCTAFLHGNLHEEIWLRRPPGFTGTTLAALGFIPSTADPSLFLLPDTSLPPFYVLVYVDDLVFATAGTEALTLVKSELQKRHTCTDLGPSALRLPNLLATAHSSVYRPLALSSTFGRVRRAEWSVPRANGLPYVSDDVDTT
ncbi:unnamed protein product, partial [Closterium sp. NIES-53]